MHLISPTAMGRLKANRLAWEHFEKQKALYTEFAQAMREFSWKFEKINNFESRISLVATMILEIDLDVWGVANEKTSGMSAREVAECYARLVVGHEI